MKTLEYETMAAREKTYWWHLGRLRIIDAYISMAQRGKKRLAIVNIGCGTGGTIATLEKFGFVDNVDVSEEAIKFMKQNGHSNRLIKVDDVELPFGNQSYDIVAAFDVLEHIDDDVSALKEWARVLKDNGAIVMTVPAYQWLWTDHDVSLHHKRRYTNKSLLEVVERAGLVVEKSSYAIAFSLPLVVGFRLLNKALRRKTSSETSYVDVPGWVNSLFANILYFEAKLHRITRLPFGTSLVAIVKKPNEQ